MKTKHSRLVGIACALAALVLAPLTARMVLEALRSGALAGKA